MGSNAISYRLYVYVCLMALYRFVVFVLVCLFVAVYCISQGQGLAEEMSGLILDFEQ